jgi:maleate cis-trans isomerase
MLLNTTGTIRNLQKSDIEAQIQQLERAAAEMANEAVDLVIVGGGPLFTSQGRGSENRTSQRLTELSGVPCVTGLELEMEALRAVGSVRPVIASPYPTELSDRLMAHLNEAGWDVQGAHGLGIVNNSEIGRLPEDRALEAGRAAVRAAPDADAVLMPCARWPTLAAIGALERETGLPVVSATTADIHGAFRRLGLRPRRRVGRLLNLLVDAPQADAGARDTKTGEMSRQ